ncbi:MAG: VOC family protein [Pseudomonadales bacterium]|jgi:catechol 2,3-dioxygenase-like lactoylglutathione lyase family enzyme|nr:VOC family protein [Pseudomonadales bacterium]MDP7597372.1 VOC family protein [Pseudomonadales bacterium]HJN51487.1 VOC family protein [Pseudomonadales bacterium]|tara:strand:+ start:17 stop:418 length:402 start_codon:yes stop_codon:yes gene_type:complete
MLEGINHTCIAVNDLDRSVEFYRDIVGCKVGQELDYTTVKCIPLRAGGDTLELMKVLNPEAKNLQQPMQPDEEGNVHICFQVDSIEEHAQKVKDSGAEVTSDIHEMTVGGTVIHTFYFRDPDGYALQFLKVGN